MSNLSHELYLKIDQLIPNLQHRELFIRLNLADKGLPDIQVVVFDASPEVVALILSCHVRVNGKLIANPCFEIHMHLKDRIANVITYTTNDYFFMTSVTPDKTGVRKQGNRFLYDWLHALEPTAVK